MKIRLLLLPVLFFTKVATAQIDLSDTIVFDFSHATCVGTYFEIPVSFKSTDSVYAIDFSFKYNSSILKYDSVVIYHQGVFGAGYLNPNDSTFRFTSSSMLRIPTDTVILSMYFGITGAAVTSADLHTFHAYLNGTACSYTIIDPLPPVIITVNGSLVIHQGDSVSLTASSGNGYSYLWSTGDTSQTIIADTNGTYAVTITNAVGCTAAAQVAITVTVPLPVELTDFFATATHQGIVLNWTTASEINNNFFIVQRSAEGTAWHDIKKLNGAGNSNINTNYSVTDAEPLLGINYYRLKQTDFNGSFALSKTIAVYFGKTDAGISVSTFPNPFSDKLTFTLQGSQPAQVTLQDVSGRVLFRQGFTNTLPVNTHLFSKGIYFYNVISTAGVIAHGKVVKN